MRSQGGLGYSPGITPGGAPAAHASTHASGGSDPIAPDDIGALSHPVTDFVGGDSSIDAIITANGAVALGSIRFCTSGSVLSIWELTDDVAAEDVSGGVIRADDYATTTNERVWLQIG